MLYSISYYFVVVVNGKPIDKEEQPAFEAKGLADLPSIGDHIMFRNREDGPKGSFIIKDRYVEFGMVGGETHCEVIIHIEQE